mmetsp:Transcript_21394/g.38690  ORF Transcript_21394/g.38690 Transcript_21394/m.38690 type:complete len:118 (-) Transcript_21394:667-1020(-)
MAIIDVDQHCRKDCRSKNTNDHDVYIYTPDSFVAYSRSYSERANCGSCRGWYCYCCSIPQISIPTVPATRIPGWPPACVAILLFRRYLPFVPAAVAALLRYPPTALRLDIVTLTSNI